MSAMLKPVAEGPEASRPKRRRLKNVPVLPTLLTLGNLLCGFSAIYFCMRTVYGVGAGVDPVDAVTLRNQHIDRMLPTFLAMSAWCVFLGMVFDAFDGFVARISHKASRFGIELDSLADVVTFGVAPAILIIAVLTQAKHDWQLAPLTEDRLGRGRWMLLAVYVACAAIRLARFNVETSMEEAAHRGFKGLPSPAAAGVIASLVILHEHLVFSRTLFGLPIGPWLADGIVTTMPFVALLVALLMVSRFDYRHVINVYLLGRRPVGYVMAALALLIVLVLQAQLTIAVGMCLYAMSGPARRLTHLWRRPAPAPTRCPDTDVRRDDTRIGKTG